MIFFEIVSEAQSTCSGRTYSGQKIGYEARCGCESWLAPVLRSVAVPEVGKTATPLRSGQYAAVF